MAEDKYAPRHPPGWPETLAYIKHVLEESGATTPKISTTKTSKARVVELLKLMQWTTGQTKWENNGARQLDLVRGYVAEAEELVSVEDVEAALKEIGEYWARLEVLRLLLPRTLAVEGAKFRLLTYFHDHETRAKAVRLLK